MASLTTPGPWRIDPLYPSDVQSIDGTIEVAMAYIQDDTPNAKAQSHANARLIAAAPALADAADELLVAFSEGVSWTGEKRASYSRLHQALLAARSEVAHG